MTELAEDSVIGEENMSAVLEVDMSGKPMKPLLNRKEQLRSKRLYWVCKRIQGIILSSIALIMLSPVFIIIALAIYT